MRRPHNTWIRSISTLLFWTLAATAARADAVILVSDDRRSTDMGMSCSSGAFGDYTCGDAWNREFRPSPPFADWGDSLVSPLAMSDSGSGNSFSDIGWWEENDIFDVTFDVLSPVAVVFEGELEAGGGWGGGRATAEITNDAGWVLFAEAYDSVDSFLLSEILMPGRHRVVVRTWAGGGTYGRYEFSLTMEPTVVPEPGTALLAGLGLALAAMCGRRRRAACVST